MKMPVTKVSEETRHYFDWAASAPCDSSSLCAPLIGNPSSLHAEGRAAKQLLEDARNRSAAVLNVPADTLFFTSGGTESNSIALFSNLMRKGQGRILASTAEHSSVREGIETLERMGKPTGKIAVDSSGRVTPALLEKALEKHTDARFAAIMSVNNETGAITDIASLRDVIRKRKDAPPVHFHCDLVQAVGKIPLDIPLWEIDSASISGHKIGAPRGIGLLYLRNKTDIFYTGGGQENGVRGGTENTQGAAALACCLEKYAGKEVLVGEIARAKSRWKKLIDSLCAMGRCTIIPQERTQTENEERFSPYILQAAFTDVPGEVMARALDDLGFAVSTGSACASSSPERPVLAAMGVDENLRIEGIRISQGASTTDEEIDLFLEAVAEVLKFL
jgi:cysteine desulfurase